MKKILIVEDDQFLSKVLNAKFSSAGFEVVVAENGTKALLDIEHDSFDIVLLDLIIPDKDGFEVLKSIKASEKSKNTPVVITSNLSQPEDVKRTQDLGAQDYIVKSDSSITEIVARVQKILDKKS